MDGLGSVLCTRPATVRTGVRLEHTCTQLHAPGAWHASISEPSIFNPAAWAFIRGSAEMGRGDRATPRLEQGRRSQTQSRHSPTAQTKDAVLT
jgi:hypothetical protein